MEIKPLHPLFAAEVIGLDLVNGPDAATFSEIHDAFEKNAVLVFRDQKITDDQQISFSERFGELETTKVGTPGAGSKLITLTNIGPGGEIFSPTDKQVLSAKANRQWHADSSFKEVAAYASMLSAREIPSGGGNTEYLSMRAVYADLPDDLKSQADS
ncbi:MAG: TauD/TfdA family dioxygenase, partial [Pseudomonadota bacterium]